MSGAADLPERMHAFRQRFFERVRRDRVDIAGAWQDGDHATLIRLCHGLAGNAGMFGFRELGLLAGRVEGAIEQGRIADIDQAIGELLTGMDQIEDPRIGSVPNKD